MICDSPYWVLPKAGIEKVPVPCGKCPPCKLRRVNNWVFRLLQEDKISSSSHFVTLTYDTRFVPISDNGFMTLRKRDFQLFMKRLRKLVPDSKLKYYAVGEYGSQNKRPHYHAIVFNCPDINLFSDAWALDNVSIGSVHVGHVSGDSIAYTMKYIDKPNFGRVHHRDDRECEFPVMSKCLGANYLTDAVVDYHKADLSRLYVTREGGHKVSLPRYYRDKIYSDDDKVLQVKMIQAIVVLKDLDEIKYFKRMYANTSFDFHTWKESKRYARYESFYHNHKPRVL